MLPSIATRGPGLTVQVAVRVQLGWEALGELLGLAFGDQNPPLAITQIHLIRLPWREEEEEEEEEKHTDWC